MARLFGTDGIRGVANRDLTPDLALALGRAAGFVLAPDGGEVVIGRDTRLSGPMLEAALVAGLCSAGVEVRLAGIIPTPGVAFVTQDEKARAGAVISASHNPVPDNGIKFFSEQAMKISGELEDAIEAAMATSSSLPVGDGIGGAQPLVDAEDRYVAHLLDALAAPLTGLRIVLDCAYGAAWRAGPRAFREAGADVVALNAEPDGARINVECGSTSLGQLARTVVQEGADLGVAFDGDADRALAVDDRGEVVDGDEILALTALDLEAKGALDPNVVVVTVMANLGLRRLLEQRGFEVLSVPVGDKYVSAAMADRGALLGGEQSGHVIFGRHSATGDGLLTGLKVAEAVASSDRPLSDLAHVFEPCPQVLINVEVGGRDRLEGAQELWDEVARVESALGEDGRVLLRPSGTEPLVRVMVEAFDARAAEDGARRLADAVRRHLA